MNQQTVSELETLIQRDYGNLTGISVSQNGKVKYERYFLGSTQDTAFHVFSVTKSIVSLLIGITINQGLIQSVDQNVLAFFPDYPVKRGEKTIQTLTLRHLLTMTAPYKYKSAPYTKYFSSDDWVRASLDLLGGKGKVGDFRYAPLIGPDILSGMIASVTGRSMLDFAREYLFAPLEIDVKENVVFRTKEEQLDIMKNYSRHGWVADPQGNNTAGWGLFLTLSDMEKIGQLYLNHGVWNGKQIVSEAWIRESTSVHSHLDRLAYGYLWWIISEAPCCYAALGDGGNAIYINSRKKLVVAIASQLKPSAKDRIEFIRSQIEPMLDQGAFD